MGRTRAQNGASYEPGDLGAVRTADDLQGVGGAHLGTERVGVVDVSVTDERDGLEPSMGVLREARHGAAVVHLPATGAGEVHAEIPRGERGRRAHVLVGLGIPVEVVNAEQERVDGRPRESEGDDLTDRIAHRWSPFGSRPTVRPRDRTGGGAGNSPARLGG